MDEDDDNGLEWHTIAWLQNTILESGCKINEYNKKMGMLAALVEDGKNYHIEWDSFEGTCIKRCAMKKDWRKIWISYNGYKWLRDFLVSLYYLIKEIDMRGH